MESGDSDTIYYDPKHPYTRGLLRSIPKIGTRTKGKLDSIEGVVPLPLDTPPRCGFFDRCDHMIPGLCDSCDVPIVDLEPGHSVRCFLYPEVVAAHESRRVEDE